MDASNNYAWRSRYDTTILHMSLHFTLTTRSTQAITTRDTEVTCVNNNNESNPFVCDRCHQSCSPLWW